MKKMAGKTISYNFFLDEKVSNLVYISIDNMWF